MTHSDWRSALRAEGETILDVHSELAHEWQESESTLTLRIPALARDGFDVELVADSRGVELRAGGFHTHYDEPGDAEGRVREAFGLVRDLLSPAMRLRELRAGDAPYRWVLEVATETGWRTDQTMGLLFWNYLGRRSEAVFQNRHLAARKP